MEKIIWSAERREVKTLRNWAKNPRKLKKDGLEKLKERIKARGFHDVIKIDTDGTILSGNQRKRALTELSVKEVIALVPNRRLTEEERNSVALESNTHDADWDFEALKSFKLDMLTDIGFDKSELQDIWNESLEVEDDEWDEEKELAKIKKPTTRLGDLIELGSHRIICGDSTDPAVIKRLFGKEKASLIYSDPIYNLKIDYAHGIGGKRNYGGDVNDTRSYDEYKEFIRKSLVNALSVAKDDVHTFYWCDQIYIGLIQGLYRELGIENKRVCIWLKNNQNPTPLSAFNKVYEPCVYGLRGSPFIAKQIKNLNEILNKEITTGNNLLDEALDCIDVWSMKRLPSQSYEHATSKPPALHQKAIRRCTRPGDIILDSFLGSASTLVAAEQLKRRVFGIELEPAFCDLAIRRYEKLTGKKAKITHTHEKN